MLKFKFVVEAIIIFIKNIKKPQVAFFHGKSLI